jgi:hypothetical protein
VISTQPHYIRIDKNIESANDIYGHELCPQVINIENAIPQLYNIIYPPIYTKCTFDILANSE